MEIRNTLSKLGLNNRQIEVYLALLKLGKNQAGPIIKETGLHRMQVYEAIESLKDLGLISISQKKTIQFFEASSPEKLVELESEKLDIAKLASQELLESFKNLPQVEVRQLSGSEGMFSNLVSFIHEASNSNDKTLRMIGGASDNDFYDALGSHYKDYVKLTKQYNVKKRLLGPAEVVKVTSARFSQEQDAEVKILPPSFNHPIYTRICATMISIEFYYPVVTIIQIKSPIVAASYIANFDLIWDSIK